MRWMSLCFNLHCGIAKKSRMPSAVDHKRVYRLGASRKPKITIRLAFSAGCDVARVWYHLLWMVNRVALVRTERLKI